MCMAGRCSVMSDLRVITFDGNNVALYDNGSFILVTLPGETIIGTVEKCPTSQVTCQGLNAAGTELYTNMGAAVE